MDATFVSEASVARTCSGKAKGSSASTLWFVGFLLVIPFAHLRGNGGAIPWWGRIYAASVTRFLVVSSPSAHGDSVIVATMPETTVRHQASFTHYPFDRRSS